MSDAAPGMVELNMHLQCRIRRNFSQPRCLGPRNAKKLTPCRTLPGGLCVGPVLVVKELPVLWTPFEDYWLRSSYHKPN